MNRQEFTTFWQEVHTIVDEVMKNGNMSVAIYISPDGGISVNVAPWVDEETLWGAHEQGKISYNDYREILGLPPVKVCERKSN